MASHLTLPPAFAGYMRIARRIGERRRTIPRASDQRPLIGYGIRRPPRDPEFGYRVLVDKARDAGQAMVDRTAGRICCVNGWWSVFGKKKPYAQARRAGVPAHDDHVGRQFVAAAPNQLSLADITEDRTEAGKLCLCAVKTSGRTGSSATPSTRG